MLLEKIIVAKGLSRQFSSATIDELLAGSMPHREFDQLVRAIFKSTKKILSGPSSWKGNVLPSKFTSLE